MGNVSNLRIVGRVLRLGRSLNDGLSLESGVLSTKNRLRIRVLKSRLDFI